jgi:hypothetical protein
MCAELISVIFFSSMANGWPWSNWKFWFNPFSIVLYATVITGTVFVLSFHILLTLIPTSLYLLVFSVSLVLMFESCRMAISISRQVFCFLSCSAISCQFASIVQSVITGTSHIIVEPLTFMTLSGICSQYLSVTCNPCVYLPSSGCSQPPHFVYWCTQMVQVLCILQQYVLCVLPYSTFWICYQLVATWCSSDDNTYWALDLGPLLSKSQFFLLGLIYITTPGIFLYLLGGLPRSC